MRELLPMNTTDFAFPYADRIATQYIGPTRNRVSKRITRLEKQNCGKTRDGNNYREASNMKVYITKN